LVGTSGRTKKGKRRATDHDLEPNVMGARFVPTHYNRDLLKNLQLLKQGTKSVEDYYQEMKIAMIRAS
jgi:hypothetical protein